MMFLILNIAFIALCDKFSTDLIKLPELFMRRPRFLYCLTTCKGSLLKVKCKSGHLPCLFITRI